MLKWISIIVAVAIIILQFIRPSRNTADTAQPNDIGTVVEIPTNIREILHTSCYDCHSNSTRYPWYAEVQPIGWWLNGHIQDARKELNFSEFAGYTLRRQYIKLQQIADEVTDEKMPLPSYLIAHSDAKLSTEQKERLIAWAFGARDRMMEIYPADSLKKRRTE